MNRRDMLRTSGAAVLGLSAFPLRWAAAADKKPQKVLYFTRSAGFVHSVVNRKNSELAHSEKVLTEMGKKAGFEVVCSQEESVFDGDLDQFDLIAFYTTGKVISDERKEKLLKAIDAGKGFVGFHCATDTFHSQGPRSVPRHGRRRVHRARGPAEGDDEDRFAGVPRDQGAGRLLRAERGVVHVPQVRSPICT